MLDCRVLDLTNERGYLCGKILSDLGAEVVKVDPPDEDFSTDVGSSFSNQKDRERLLFWLAFNRGKKSITLNIEESAGRTVFRDLVGKADIVIESYMPGYLNRLGLGYDILSKVNPGLVYTAISDFGQNGPYAEYVGSDLVDMALSGYLFLCGDSDRPPVNLSFPIAYSLASAEAAVGSLMALYYRNLTGLGQSVDISVQEVATVLCANAFQTWELYGEILCRTANMRLPLSSGVISRQLWECKDGWCSFSIFGGKFGGKINRGLVSWMEEKGMADEFLKRMDWDQLDMTRATPEFVEELERRFDSFFKCVEKREIYEKASSHGIVALPVRSIKEVFDDPQMKARGYWDEVKHTEVDGCLLYPGIFVKTFPVYLKPTKDGPPSIGEHNEQVYRQWLGLTSSSVDLMRKRGIV